MFTTSSRLFLFNGPLSLFHHRPSTLLRLPHRHAFTCPLHPLSTVTHRHLLPSRANSHVLIKSSQQLHGQSTSNTLQEKNHVSADAYLVPPSHPWPEWSELLDSISNSGYFDLNRNLKDEFVPNEGQPMEFVDAACSCLGFAHDRSDILGWLPKDDMQVLIDAGAPFLFKNAIETERRMRSFLQGEELNDVTTVDLMKYVLSYASNPVIYPKRNIREAIESSARNLLKEIANFSLRGAALSMPAMEKFNEAGEDAQTPRNLEPYDKMKRGDWICPKCSFTNFAKTTECLECMESRPRRQVTGCKWDCPRCNFYNHGRNVICLKCECERPGTNNNLDRLTDPKSTSGGQYAGKDDRFPIPNGRNSGYAPFVPLPSDMFAKKPENMKIDDGKESVTKNSEPKATVLLRNSENLIESRAKDAAEEEKSEKWFKNVAEAIPDDDFPEIMPMRKGDNRFVVSKKKDRSLTSPKFQRQQAMEQGSNTSFVPFVPFPPDYFAKKDNKQQSTDAMQETQNRGTASKDFLNSRSSFDNGGGSRGNQTANSSSTQMNRSETRPETSYGGQKTPEIENDRDGGASSGYETVNLSSTQLNRSETRSETAYSGRKTQEIENVRNGGASNGNKTENSSSTQMNRSESRPKTSSCGRKTPEIENVENSWEGKSLEGSAVKENDPLDMSEEAKAERWFRRVAQIKDISELSQIPDEDFPAIMPMRKGVNRFVVSKRKTPLERRLTSPQYRKNLRSDPTKKEGDGS